MFLGSTNDCVDVIAMITDTISGSASGFWKPRSGCRGRQVILTRLPLSVGALLKEKAGGSGDTEQSGSTRQDSPVFQ